MSLPEIKRGIMHRFEVHCDRLYVECVRGDWFYMSVSNHRLECIMIEKVVFVDKNLLQLYLMSVYFMQYWDTIMGIFSIL